jgi:RimJ/RimL family protein N-acetyltransferase
MRVLTTPHCTLEPLVAAHAAEMFEVLGDPAIYEFENAPPPSLAGLAERYAGLESRSSPDGSERWLNWVVRLPDGRAAGYVQATVRPDGAAHIAYELASRHWRQGIGRAAVQAMMAELGARNGVHTFVAVLKAANHRSLGLLRSLGFAAARAGEAAAYEAEADEQVMVKAGALATAACVRRFRPLVAADQDKLWHWLHVALWDPPPAGLRPIEVLQTPGVRIYGDGWGRPTDVGVVAQVDGTDAGACWLRLLPVGVGLASVDAETPQLAIALEPRFQHQGHGRPMMLEALAAARRAGYRQAALTVHPENPAQHMYERCGFRQIDRRNGFHLMVARLA